jgi:hypothetical protein
MPPFLCRVLHPLSARVKLRCLLTVLALSCLLLAQLCVAQTHQNAPLVNEQVLILDRQQILNMLTGYGARALEQVTITSEDGSQRFVTLEPTVVAQNSESLVEITDAGTSPLAPEIFHFKAVDGDASHARVSIYRRDPDGKVIITGLLRATQFPDSYLGFESLPINPIALEEDGPEIAVAAAPIDPSRLPPSIANCEIQHRDETGHEQTTVVETGLGGPGGYGDRTILYRNANLMLDADWEYVQALGSAGNASAVIQATVNSLNGIFEPQLNIRLTISGLTVWNTANDPFNSALNPHASYQEYIYTGVRVNSGYDLAQLFSGRIFPGNEIAGEAALGSCAEHSTSAVTHYNVVAYRVNLSAHEIGHLLFAGHTDDGIMFPRVSAFTHFNDRSRDEINTGIGSRGGCLQSVTDDPLPGGIPQFEILRSGSSESERRLLQLRWAAPLTGPLITGYQVFKAGTESVCSGQPYMTVGGEAILDPTPINPGEFYQYSVQPVSAAGLGTCAPVEVVSPAVSISSIEESTETDFSSVRLVLSVPPFAPTLSSVQIFRSTTPQGCIGTPVGAQELRDQTSQSVVTAPLAGYASQQYFSVRPVTLGNVGACSAPVTIARPPAPTGLSATTGEHQDRVEVRWHHVLSARIYHIYRFELGRPETQVHLGSTTITQDFTDTTANADGRHYNYFVQACNASGCASTGYALGYRNALPPAPTGVSASDGTSSNSISVTWNPVTFGDVTSYKVYRSVIGPDGPYVLAGTTVGAEFVDFHPDIRFGYRVAYKVSAVTTLGEGPLSSFDNGFVQVALPAAVQISSVTEPLPVPQPPTVTVAWSNTAGAPSFFDLYRSTSNTPCSGALVLRTSLQQTNYSLPFEIPQYGVPHYFSIRALNGAGVGPCSTPVAVALPPSAASVVATQGTFPNSVNLTWSGNGLVRQFTLQRRIAGDAGSFSNISVGTGTFTNFTDSSADADGTRYEYRVLGCNVSGCTASNSAIGWRAAAPSAPLALSATDSTILNAIDLSWLPPARGNISTYRVEIAESIAGPFTTLATQSSATTSYRVNSGEHVRYGEQRFFRVIAEGTLGISGPSNVDVGAALVNIPGSPTNVIVTETAAPALSVRWSPASGAFGRYSVYRSTSAGAGCSGAPLVAGLTATTFTDTNFTYGIQYYYSVNSQNVAGTSSCSAIGTRALPSLMTTSASDATSTSLVSVTGTGASGVVTRSFRKSESGPQGPFVEMTRGTSLVYDDAAAPADGTTVWYTVVGCNASGCGTGTIDTGRRRAPPQAALNVIASDNSFAGLVRITWNANPRGTVSQYAVQRAGSPTGPFVTIGQLVSGSTFQFDDESAVPNATYYYRIESRGDAAPEAYSSVDSGIAGPSQLPGAPTNVEVAEVNRTLSITWTEPVGSIGRYSVYRSTLSAERCAATPIVSGLNNTGFIDTGISYGTQYFYTVRASNIVGDGPCSPVGTLQAPTPATISASDATSQSAVEISISGGARAATFSLRRSESGAAGPFAEIESIVSTSYADINAASDGTTAWYTAIPCNASGCSTGTVDSGRRAAAPLPALAVSASDGTFVGRVRVVWSANPRGYARDYLVQRAPSVTGTFTVLGTVPATNQLIFDDLTAQPGVGSHYRIVTNGDLQPQAISAIDLGSAQESSSSSSSSSSNSSSSNSTSSSSSSMSSSSTSSSSTSSSSSSSSTSSSQSSSSSSVSSSSSSLSSSSSSVSSSSSATSSSSSQSTSSSFSSGSSSSADLTSSSSSVSLSSSSSAPSIFGSGTQKIPSGSKLSLAIRLSKVTAKKVKVQVETKLTSATGVVLAVAPNNGCKLDFIRKPASSRPPTRIRRVDVRIGHRIKTKSIKVPGGARPVSNPRPSSIFAKISCGSETLTSARWKIVVPRRLNRIIRVREIAPLVARAAR